METLDLSMLLPFQHYGYASVYWLGLVFTQPCLAF